MRVPWIAVCTDAEGRRPGHPILGEGVPHPRTYGSTARVLGEYVRRADVIDLETAVAKLSARAGGARRAASIGACCARARSPTSSCSIPRRSPTSPPTSGRPCTRRASGTSSSTAGPPCWRRRDRRAARPAPAARADDARRQPATETEALARLPGGELRYVLRRSPRSRRLRVTIVPERGVVVSIPVAGRRGWARPEPIVTAFLAEREAWIRRHLGSPGGAAGAPRRSPRARRRSQRPLPRVAAPRRGSSRRGAGLRSTRVSRVGGDDGDELVVERVARDRRRTAAILEAWFRARARAALDVAIDRHAPPLGVSPARITIRDTTSRWGSCSRKGSLSFSWRLVLAPPAALDAVAAHELCHLRVFGHGPAFVALLDVACPGPCRLAPLAAPALGRSCTRRSTDDRMRTPVRDERPDGHGRMSLDSGTPRGNHIGALKRHRTARTSPRNRRGFLDPVSHVPHRGLDRHVRRGSLRRDPGRAVDARCRRRAPVAADPDRPPRSPCPSRNARRPHRRSTRATWTATVYPELAVEAIDASTLRLTLDDPAAKAWRLVIAGTGDLAFDRLEIEVVTSDVAPLITATRDPRQRGRQRDGPVGVRRSHGRRGRLPRHARGVHRLGRLPPPAQGQRPVRDAPRRRRRGRATHDHGRHRRLAGRAVRPRPVGRHRHRSPGRPDRR